MNIQEEKLFKLTTKEDKIDFCIQFLKLDLERLDVDLEINKIERDFNFEFNKSKNQNEVYHNLFSKVCALNIQQNLIKTCLKKPTVSNLTNYMNFRTLDIYRVKDLLTSWENLQNSFAILKSKITRQKYPGKIYKKIVLRCDNVEKRNKNLLLQLNSYIDKSYCLQDLPIKPYLINFLIINNEDVCKFMRFEET
ncbi:hypothetical protein NBO_162g0002 [Nosema bombycis CQ1]|uniref:Uncharacterized protein n=1 Tax=Nosema bombycis (strain CQ1 / CVCC 102059) TaxID=578461 RepID=R0KQX0_NOSB1|nr:hypothetical protein NBO_162g0002 [Nosema bombycis CQ1]|eukprot:EOB13136.1 hypothetical protein NBO_162g0002 [Nosema bombycis CQ1]